VAFKSRGRFAFCTTCGIDRSVHVEQRVERVALVREANTVDVAAIHQGDPVVTFELGLAADGAEESEPGGAQRCELG